MATDYASLQTEIIAEAWRTGDAQFNALVPGYITRAEARMNRALRVAEMETTGSITLTSGAGSLPADVEEIRSVASGSPGQAMQLVAPGFAIENYPTNPGGWPNCYSIIGNALQTYPSGTGPVAISYYAKIPALSDSNTTNWLLTKAPDIYLYAAMVEAAPSMMDDARLQLWMTMYQGALRDIQNADKGKRWSNARARVSGPTP